MEEVRRVRRRRRLRLRRARTAPAPRRDLLGERGHRHPVLGLVVDLGRQLLVVPVHVESPRRTWTGAVLDAAERQGRGRSDTRFAGGGTGPEDRSSRGLGGGGGAARSCAGASCVTLGSSAAHARRPCAWRRGRDGGLAAEMLAALRRRRLEIGEGVETGAAGAGRGERRPRSRPRPPCGGTPLPAALSFAISSAKAFRMYALRSFREKKLPLVYMNDCKVVVEIHRRLVAIVHVLREGLEHDLLELLGDPSIVGRRRHDLDVADLLERREVALADEEPLAREQLVQARCRSAKMSLRRSRGRPRTCSGDM